MSQLKDAISEFEKLQDKYAKYGAADTEPSAVLRGVMRKALARKSVTWDREDFWQLYEMPGAMDVGQELTAAAKKIYELVLVSRDQEAEYAKSFCGF